MPRSLALALLAGILTLSGCASEKYWWEESPSMPLQPSDIIALLAIGIWLAKSIADIAKYKVNFPPYIVQTESVNPAFVLYELSWGATSAAPLGRTTFDGRPAESYLVTVNLIDATSHSACPATDCAASGSGGRETLFT